MSYSIDPITADCYPGTTVLINKLDIHDEATLNEVETTDLLIRVFNESIF